MRTHAEIVAAAGPERLSEMRGVSIHTARSWAQRDSIPGEHWHDLADKGVATLQELAAAAAEKRAPRPTAQASVA